MDPAHPRHKTRRGCWILPVGWNPDSKVGCSGRIVRKFGMLIVQHSTLVRCPTISIRLGCTV